LRIRVLGATHPDTLTMVVSVAWSFKELGHFMNAVDLEVHALDMGIQVL
jgi:hypothetical protein